MRVVLSRDALVDLDDIAGWISRDDAESAGDFTDELRKKCASLSDSPRRYPVACIVGGAEVRKLSHRGYIVFYEAGAEEVVIARILHGARDWTALFDSE